MKILAISDLHGLLPDIEPCHILLIAGDICPDFWDGRSRDQQQRHWLNTKFRVWLEHIPAERVVGIAGNHDFVFEKPWLLPRGLRWTYLRDESTQVGDLWIHGTPWVPSLPGWAFHGREPFLEARAQDIPRCDVLLSHGPPYGYGDRVVNGSHVGDGFLNKHVIAEQRTPVIVCGHIHEAWGVYQTPEGVAILNVSHVNEKYDPDNTRPAVEIAR